MDVVVVGAGPAGMALAAACGQRGLTVGLVDPNPDRPWVATYGMWAPELPADLPDSVVAARAAGRAIALTEHRLGWEYAILDVDALRAHLAGQFSGVTVYTGRAVRSPEPGVVQLADGSSLRGSVVVDAAGRWRPLDPIRSPRVPAEQTAYGVILDDETVSELVAPGDALFMDWRPDHGESGWPTFVYVVPLGGGKVLVEETSLARRPGLPLATLRRRLHARLKHHGIAPPDHAPTEKVSFRVDHPRHAGSGALGFGAAAPLIHPASGFSVAASLQLAPRVAAALAEHLPGRPDRALAAAQETVWSPAAKLIHRVRGIGLEALLRMPAAEVPGFFEQFFALPDAQRWAYLTARDDVGGTLAAMAGLFRESDWRLRRRLVLPALMRPLRTNDDGPPPN
ncbi:lycopene cyclase family protein [Mycobacterium sp. shizuoka-1]|uniref:lycopene cyclase family protein n=1 Tax=Mycobacterium sp. shizuoka-1 TaxID=2039281 RepID=UPI000C063C2C|nr:lycopene cyclase family protein [Mycobacterium sp. shizuoka-1]GAY19257.1 putative carotenoid cyclase [Mycobacterium sp. shizuoka-1]